MKKEKTMGWVDSLPGVAGTDFQTRRNQIVELLEKAEDAAREAEAKRVEAEKLRSQAYNEAISLEVDAKNQWSFETVENTKNRAGR